MRSVVRSVRRVRVLRQVAARLLRLLHSTDTDATRRFPHKYTIRMDCSAPPGTPRVHQQRHRVAPRMAHLPFRRALRVPNMHHRSVPASSRSDIKLFQLKVESLELRVMICPTCRVISNMLALKSNHKYVVIFIFIYELLSIGGLGKSQTKRAESPKST